MKQNEMLMSEKLIDVLTRNYSTLQIKYVGINDKYSLLHFKKHGGFNYNDLKGIFNYWGVDWKHWVKEWSVECNNNITVFVKLFIYNTVKCEKNHNMRLNRGWGLDTHICNKCGLFGT